MWPAWLGYWRGWGRLLTEEFGEALSRGKACMSHTQSCERAFSGEEGCRVSGAFALTSAYVRALRIVLVSGRAFILGVEICNTWLRVSVLLACPHRHLFFSFVRVSFFVLLSNQYPCQTSDERASISPAYCHWVLMQTRCLDRAAAKKRKKNMDFRFPSKSTEQKSKE